MRTGAPTTAAGASPRVAVVVGDLVLAVIFVGSSAVLLKVLSPRADAVDWWFAVLVGLPLAVRRHAPRSCAVAVGVVALAQHPSLRGAGGLVSLDRSTASSGGFPGF